MGFRFALGGYFKLVVLVVETGLTFVELCLFVVVFGVDACWVVLLIVYVCC